MSWSLVQVFLVVAEQGSLSAAARLLRQSQPTLGRQVRALEAQLGAELFHRHDKGLTPTELGFRLLASARTMRGAAQDIALQAAGQAGQLAGSVRISASVAVTLYHLPRLIAELRQREPLIAIDLVASDATSNLHFREADIAIRMYRPKQLDLIAQHVGELSFSAFASQEYVERRGLPTSPAELPQHDFVGFDQDQAILDGFRGAGFQVTRDFFHVRTDDTATYWALVRAGCGIGFAQRVLGQAEAGLVELPLAWDLPSLPVWLTAHEAIRRVPRVERVWTFLAAGLREITDR